jgi:hypothetical protein
MLKSPARRERGRFRRARRGGSGDGRSSLPMRAKPLRLQPDPRNRNHYMPGRRALRRPGRLAGTAIADAMTSDVLASTVAMTTHVMRTRAATRTGHGLDARRRAQIHRRHRERGRFDGEREREKGSDQEQRQKTHDKPQRDSTGQKLDRFKRTSSPTARMIHRRHHHRHDGGKKAGALSGRSDVQDEWGVGVIDMPDGLADHSALPNHR